MAQESPAAWERGKPQSCMSVLDSKTVHARDRLPQVKLEISPACVTYCDPDPDLDPDPAHAPAPVFARGWRPGLAVFLPGLLGCPLVARPGLSAERFHLPFAATASAGRLGHPAGLAQGAGYPAA